jgi:hypothetical protein
MNANTTNLTGNGGIVSEIPRERRRLINRSYPSDLDDLLRNWKRCGEYRRHEAVSAQRREQEAPDFETRRYWHEIAFRYREDARQIYARIDGVNQARRHEATLADRQAAERWIERRLSSCHQIYWCVCVLITRTGFKTILINEESRYVFEGEAGSLLESVAAALDWYAGAERQVAA